MSTASAGLRRHSARTVRYVAALVGAALLAAPAAAAAPLPSRSAAGFRDSIGVQTHFGFTGHPYDRSGLPELEAMLRALGVRHLRDDTCFLEEADCTRVRSRLASMRDAFGPKGPAVDLLAVYTRELAAITDRGGRDADITRALTAAARPPLAGMLAGLEPVNEPDLKVATDWTGAAIADDNTFNRLLAQPRFAALRDVPHLSPAIGRAENTLTLLARGWSKARADIGNFHPYPPAWGGPENGLTTRCGAGDVLTCAAQLGAAAQPWATESGYSTSGSPISTSWVSERAQAVYLPRLLLGNYDEGVARTYLYELVDLRPAGSGSAVDGYGLWRARYSGLNMLPGSPKPAALAISRLNTFIGDLGAGNAAATSLDVSVRAGGRELGDDSIRRILLRRADGSYVLALWQPQKVWDNTVFDQSEIKVPDLSTDVSIGGGPWNATVTRPTVGDALTGTANGVQRLTLPIGADVTLVALNRVGGNNPGTANPPPTDPRAAAQAAAAKAAWDYLTKLLYDALQRAAR